MKKKVIIILLSTIMMSYSANMIACTTFCLKTADRIVFGFNFDYQVGEGYIYVNKRNVERQRCSFYAEEQIKWISKYGSITFNVHGREIPEGGMNEMGLVVTSLGFDESIYPGPDERLPIDEAG
jgi:penicillin V acylase-like amidase (Ntn superfamily)